MWRNPFNNIGKFTDQFWKFHNFNNREIHVSFLIDLTKVDKEHWLTQGRTRQGNNRTCVRRRWALSTGQHLWRREKKDQPTYSCGHHQNQWMLRTPPSPPWPPTPQGPTLSSSPSLHLEDSHSLTHTHSPSLFFSFHTTFHLALQEPPSRWQTFLKPLTSEQSFSLSPRSQTVANVARPTKRATKPTGRRERRRATGFQRLRPASQSLTPSPNDILFSIWIECKWTERIHSFMSNESPKVRENMTHL